MFENFFLTIVSAIVLFVTRKIILAHFNLDIPHGLPHLQSPQLNQILPIVLLCNVRVCRYVCCRVTYPKYCAMLLDSTWECRELIMLVIQLRLSNANVTLMNDYRN